MPKTTVIKKIGIVTKRNNAGFGKLVEDLKEYLEGKKKEVFFDTHAAKLIKIEKGYSKQYLMKKMDLVIALGGDGTLLKTARQCTYKKVLILGVNIGNLGFLTECPPSKLHKTLDKIFRKQYFIDKRALLRVTHYRKGKKLETTLALNDAVINQGSFARLITLDLELDNRKMVKFKADGMIVATPTGSTAHSLSAGGPIIHPKIESLVITPICPSSLSLRPIVIPGNRQLVVRIETQRREESDKIGLTIDGQETMELQYGDILKIRRSKRKSLMVRTGNRYYKILRDKLDWG